MIIACPACQTRYTVPDSAIRAEGRTVRCAKCEHSWFQEGARPEPTGEEDASAEAPEGGDAAPAAEQEPESRDEGEAAPEGETAESPVADPAIEEPAPVETGATDEEELVGSPFDPEPPFARRRNRVRLWSWVAAILVLIAVGTIVAISYWGLPDWAPVDRPEFAGEQPGLQLEFPPEQQEQYRLGNGTEFFGASGTVTNVGQETLRVPPILIVLRNAEEQVVYRWEVVAPKRTLAPGESVTINEAMADVPSSAMFAEIGWKPE